MRVLIAEDEALVALDVGEAVTELGHDLVATVTTAAQAIAVASTTKVDLALVNIHLADGKTAGLTLAKHLHAQFGVHTIFISGQDRDARSLRDIAIGYLPKPWAIESLESALSVAEHLIAGENAERIAIHPSFELFAGPNGG